MANQITIDIGAAANDGTGDPLRTAFNYVNNNFSNVWNTGLPNSNVQFSDNRILTVNTNANLVLAPNGIGKVASNVDIVPNTANVFSLGGTARRWNTVYGQYLDLSHNATIGGNLTVTGNITGGNIHYTGNVFVGDLEGSVFDGASSIVLDVIDSAIYVDNYYYANGVPFSGGSGNYGNANVAAYLPTYTGNISAGNAAITNLTSSNLVNGRTGTFTGDQYSDGAMYIGSPAGTVLGSDVVIQITANSGGYSQTNFQNINAGETASSDYILTADNGNDTTHYLDLGITSSGWDGSETNVLANLVANNGYLYVQDGNLTLGTRNGNTSYSWNFDTSGNLTVAGNVIFADNYVYSGNTFTSPETNGILKNFKWEFSDLSSGADTVTLQWNLLDTTFPQWYLTTNSQGNTYVFDGDAKTLGFLDNSVNSGTLTFGTAANNGAGSSNDIELTTVTGNAYVRTGSNSWKFDNTGVLTSPGNITTTGNISGGNLTTTGNLIFSPTQVQSSAYAGGNGHMMMIDTNRTDTYVEIGTADKPFKTFAAAIAAVAAANPTGTVPYTFVLMGCSINEDVDFTPYNFNYITISTTCRSTFNNPVTFGNSALLQLTVRNVEFGDTMTITGDGTTNQLNNTSFYNVSFGGAVVVTAANSLAFYEAAFFDTVTLNNVNYLYLNGGQFNADWTIRADDTGAYPIPSNGIAPGIAIALDFIANDINFVKGGTGTYVFQPQGSRMGRSAEAYTLPAGWIISSYSSVFAGTWTNNGTWTMRNSNNVNPIAGTAPTYSGTIGGSIVTASGNISGGNISATGNISTSWLDIGNIGNIASLQADVSLQIVANASGSAPYWVFNTDGNLQVPGSINGDNNGPLLIDGNGSGVEGYISLPASNFGGEQIAIVNKFSLGNGIRLETNGGNLFFGDDGVLTVPGNIVMPPGSSLVGNGASPAPSISGFSSATFGADVTATGNISGGNILGNGSLMTGVATKTTGSWTVTSGTNTYSFTVPVNGVYQLWVNGNIANGIIAYNATVSVTNSNVPVIGQQFAWNYEGAGNPILITSIPAQIIGTAGAISNASPSVGTTTNTFDFDINNSSGGNVTVYWGYTKIS